MHLDVIHVSQWRAEGQERYGGKSSRRQRHQGRHHIRLDGTLFLSTSLVPPLIYVALPYCMEGSFFSKLSFGFGRMHGRRQGNFKIVIIIIVYKCNMYYL